MIHQFWKLFILLLIVFSFSGCASVNNGTTTLKPSSLNSYSADPNSEVGSRNNPIDLGDTAIINSWRVQVISINKNGLQLVLDSDAYSSRPSPNERFVLINIKAIYIGDESGDPRSDLRFKIVGSRGNTFSESCGYSVDTFTQNEEAFSGATIKGDLCFIVEASQIDGATVSIQGDFGTDERQFVLIPRN